MSNVKSPFFLPRISIAVSALAASAASLYAIPALGRLPIAAIVDTRHAVAWQAILCGVLIAATSAALAADHMRRRLDQRLARLGDALQRIGLGDVSVRIDDLDRRDGVGALARIIEAFRAQTTARDRADAAAAALRAMAGDLRRDAETELAHTGRALAVGEFAALVAHEIRQPISAILLNCAAADNYLSRDVVRLGEAREAIQRVRRDAERAGTVIEGIRALLSQTQPTYAAVDLNQVLDETLSLVGDDLRRAHVTLITRFSPEVSTVWGDRGQLQQVVLNLVSNAITAMGSVPTLKRVLVVRTDVAGRAEAVVSVRDTGRGLDPKAVDRLFDPLFTTRPSGMGLGLSISRSIVEAHGGRIWATPSATSSAAPGACFSFTLQNAAAAAAAGRLDATPTSVDAMVPTPARGRTRRPPLAA